MHIDDVTIGKLRQLAGIFNGQDFDELLTLPPDTAADLGWQIVVLDRGFVAVGNVVDHGDSLTITRASIIRRWGTSKGLGELAEAGPLRETVLDSVGEMTAPKRALIFTIKADETKWPR